MSMKFVELKKHIVSQERYCCYNLFGDDSFLINTSENLFFKYVANNIELNKTVLSTESFDAKNLISILGTISFLGGQKIVLLRVVDDQKTKDIADAIFEYQKNPNNANILIISSQNPLFDAKKQENLNKNQNFLCNVDCNRLDRNMIFAWINSDLLQKKASMTDDAKVLLCDYTNGYLSKISIELSKLVSYAKDRQITSDDVKLLVQKDLEYTVFELTENLGFGNSEKALQILDEMMSDKKIAPTVFSLVQNYFRRMFFASITPKTNLQIADNLGVKEYAIKKAKEQSAMFNKLTLKQIVNLCGDLDYKIKTSQIGYQNAVYYIVMYILSNNKNKAA